MTTESKSRQCVLIVDDDMDDQYMISQAFISLNADVEIKTANDGVELMDYLYKRDKFAEQVVLYPRVILLDLNMPRKDGRECLKEIKANPVFNNIPVVVYSTSNSPDDISFCYDKGASSYIVKPYSFKELLEVMDIFIKYWFNVAKTAEPNQ